jgi:cytoskeleton protein RodZ
MAEDLKKDFQKNSLKEARIEQKLTLENIALELKISADFLRFLENGNYAELPGPAYVRGYIRVYSKRLGIDPEPSLDKYNSFLIPKEKKLTSKDSFFRSFILKKFHLVSFSLIFLFLFTFLFFKGDFETNYQVDEMKKVDQVDLSNISETNIIEMSKPSILIEEKFSLILEEGSQEMLALQESRNNLILINFKDESWLEVSDKNKSIEYALLESGTSIEIKGEPPFRVLIGNVNNVELIFNGKVIDLMRSYNRRTNVGCIILPTGKCDEFITTN